MPDLIYFKRSRPSDFPFSIAVKDCSGKKLLFVTYGEDIKGGKGGVWSETIGNIHPRTLAMIEERLGEDVVARLTQIR